MRYVSICYSYDNAYANLQWDLNHYAKDLNIRKVDQRKLVVELTNGDEVHYMIVYSMAEFLRVKSECNVINSLGDLIERKKDDTTDK